MLPHSFLVNSLFKMANWANVFGGNFRMWCHQKLVNVGDYPVACCPHIANGFKGCGVKKGSTKRSILCKMFYLKILQTFGMLVGISVE